MEGNNKKPNRLSKILKSTSKHNDSSSSLPEPPLGDLPITRKPGQKATKDELRDLRDLIRYRYALDGEIWNLRDIQEYNKEVVEDKMRQSDAALAKIERILASLDDASYFSTTLEFTQLQLIRQKIANGGARRWAGRPPWNEPQPGMDYHPQFDYTHFSPEPLAPYELDTFGNPSVYSGVSTAASRRS